MSATILLVEDNPITTKLVKFALENARYTVVEAADGATALRAFEERRPQLVLLDMLLPDIDGFELFRRMRSLASGAEVPILAFSGMLSKHDEARMAESGFDDVVSKPVEPSRLLQIVRGYLPPADAPDARVPISDGEAQRTVVIADDDSVQRKMVGLRIQRAGFKVVMTADGQEALERARAVKPYAIVSDVLMPNLDGFGLCMAVRNDPVLARTPVVLISNSYLDAEDKSLAARAGADELLLRTPDLQDVIAVLKSDLVSRERVMPKVEPALEQERIRRMMSQLEKQVTAQAGLSQRCALLSAELSVLSGISQAVATEENLETALHTILASCFDAGGISLGTLYLVSERGLRAVRFGAMENWSESDIESFFGAKDLLESAIAGQSVVQIPSSQFPAARFPTLLEKTGARSCVIAPLGYRGEALGALVAMSRLTDSMPADSAAFVQAVAGQISLALTLARSFQAKDVSERKARNNAALMQLILDSMAEGVIVANERGEISHANPAASSILRRPLSTVLDVSEGRTDCPIVRGLRGERIDHVEMSIAVPGESAERWLSVNARPLENDTGVAVFRDVTDEKAASARMLVNERMASLGTLAAGVGHEINNPLMAVLGNLDMAIDDLRRARQQLAEYPLLADTLDELQDARHAADRVRSIVRDLKLFSRQDHEDIRGEVDVTQVVESSARMVWNEIRHRATLIRDFQPVPLIQANESRIGQVVLNLIVNAAHAIPEGNASKNEIVIGTRLAKDGRVVVFVRDTGIGMAPETVEKIFVPFFTTKPIGVGTGLGLSICHQIVTGLGGEISVDSKLGSGTTFSIFLPAVRGTVSEPAVEVVTRRSSRRGHVLIIDDDAIVATTIARVLARDHETTCLTSSKEAALLLAGGRRFDVILCDLMMPDLTGMDLYEELRRTAPDQAAQMIFLTGGAFTAAAQAFLAATENAHLEKPIAPASLRALVAGRILGLDEERTP